MSAHATGATAEDSKGDRGSKGAETPLPRAISAALLALAATGAMLLVAAEFTPLLHLRAGDVTVKSVQTGDNHSYAQVPLALLALGLAWIGLRTGSRPALAGTAALGLVALLIALLGDRPDTQASGLLGTQTLARAHPAIGFYLETLGAVLLLVAAGLELLCPRGSGSARPAVASRRAGG